MLTSVSLFSSLTAVGTLTRGAIGEGFGGAYLAYANIQGIVSTQSNVDLGDDGYDLIAINGRLTNDIMNFDKDANGVSMRVHYPDPSYYRGRDIFFPDESGTVLTTSSLVSSLTHVGALSNGSIVDGFGSANVASLVSRGASQLRGDVQIGTSQQTDALAIVSHINSPSLLFDANSDGHGLTLVLPDADHAIAFPNETGTVLTTVSDFSTLTAVSGLTSGSLELGFGRAIVSSLHSRGDAVLSADVTIGSALPDPNNPGVLLSAYEESLTIYSMIRSQELVFDANADGINRLTLFFPDPGGPERIDFPAETGQVLTTVSLTSSLTTVGELDSGSLGPNFGAASLASLEVRSPGGTILGGDVQLGSDPNVDSLQINGYITSPQLVFWDGDGGRLTFSMPNPENNQMIQVPEHAEGTSWMLTSRSSYSELREVGDLVTGSIGGSFGEIVVNSDIRSTCALCVLATAGNLRVLGGAEIGDEFSDDITIRGTISVKREGITTLSVDPERGDLTVHGFLQVDGVISTDSPFAASEISVATINEMNTDGGVTIEGVLIKDEGIVMTKMDTVTEYRPGEGVSIERVVMKNGALITESATGTTAKGEVDMIRIINTGHDADMDETITNIKFRQTYHDLSGNEHHEPYDMVKLSAVTESDWTDQVNSRSAYFKISVIEDGEMQERLRLTAEGDMLLNTDTIIVDGPTGNTLIHGNVTIGDMEDPRELLVKSTDSPAEIIVTSGATDARMRVEAGPSGDADLTLSSGEDQEARLTFADPSPAAAAEYSIVLDGFSNVLNFTASNANIGAGRRMLSAGTDTLMTVAGIESSVNLFGVSHVYTQQVGAVEITGELAVLNCDVSGDLVAQTHVTLGNTQLGDNSNDTVVIKGRYVNSYLLIDSDADSFNMLNLTFPSASEPHTISFPSETGELLTTASNFSTLRALSNVSVGNLVTGFGSAEVVSLEVTGGTKLTGGTSIGNDAEDPIAFAGFLSSGYLMFDTDNDDECLVLTFDDPKTDFNYYGIKTLVSVTILTARPEDISYELREFDSGLVVAQAQGSDTGIAPLALELLPDGKIYTFQVYDNYGDGILNGEIMELSVEHEDGTTYYCSATWSGSQCYLCPPNDRSASCSNRLEATGELGSFGVPGAADGPVTWFTNFGVRDGICADTSYRTPTACETQGNWNGVDGTCTIAEGGRELSEATCEASASTWRPNNVPVPPPEPEGAGWADPYFNSSHCKAEESHTVKFPTQDGTLLVKHNGNGTLGERWETFLDGDVYLGTEMSDRIFFPGTIDKEVRFTNTSVILGNEPLRFGADTYGTQQGASACVDETYTTESACTQQGIWDDLTDTCNVDEGGRETGEAECVAPESIWVAKSFIPHCSNEDYTTQVACETEGSWNGACDVAEGGREVDEGACTGAASVWITGYAATHTLTLGVPSLYNESLTITFPHESGQLLTTTSDFSTLNELATLRYLNVDGDTQLGIGDDQTVLLGDGVRDKLVVDGTIFGEEALRFDGGVLPDPYGNALENIGQRLGDSVNWWSPTDENDPSGAHHPEVVCDYESGYRCFAASSEHHQGGQDYYRAWLAGGEAGGLWITEDERPYHWIAIDLGSPHEVTEVSVTPQTYDGLPGKVCRYGTMYRPYSNGEPEDFDAILATLPTEDSLVYLSDWQTELKTPGSPGCENCWLTAHAEEDFGSVRGVSTQSFPSVSTRIVRLDIRMDGCSNDYDASRPEDNFDVEDGCPNAESCPNIAHYNRAVVDQITVKGWKIRPLITLAVGTISQNRALTLPDEDGLLLTDASVTSALTTVGALEAGSIVSGFGNAVVQDLTTTGEVSLESAVVLGDEATDTLAFKGSVVDFGGVAGHFLTLAGHTVNNDHELTLSVDDPSDDRVISFPDESGRLLTDVSLVSALTTVGALDTGSIANGFGTAVFTDSSVYPASATALTANGETILNGDVVLGAVWTEASCDDADHTTQVACEGAGQTWTANSESSVSFRGAISDNYIVFDEDPVSPEGKLTLAFPTGRTQSQTISFPLDRGGEVVTTDTLSEQLLAARVVSSVAQVVQAADTITIPSDTTFVRIENRDPNGDTNTLTFPPDPGYEGTMLVIKNEDDDIAQRDGGTATIASGEACTFIWMSGDWISFGCS
eukprot:SAG11_NODE_115_length_16019_cov_12.462940_3_plen_2137_part_00